jgi:PAS domain-containing protein
VTSNQREVVPAGDDAQFLEFLKTWNQGIAIRQGEGFVFVNQAFADICGYDTPQALLSPGSALSLVAEGDRDRVTRYYKGRIGGGRRSGLLRDAVPAQGRLSLVG